MLHDTWFASHGRLVLPFKYNDNFKRSPYFVLTQSVISTFNVTTHSKIPLSRISIFLLLPWNTLKCIVQKCLRKHTCQFIRSIIYRMCLCALILQSYHLLCTNCVFYPEITSILWFSTRQCVHANITVVLLCSHITWKIMFFVKHCIVWHIW